MSLAATLQSLAFASGPALAGMLLAVIAPGWVYGLHAVLLATSALLLASLPPAQPQVDEPSRPVRDLIEGARFVVSRKAVIGCMSLDMVAVIFGGAAALLPVYAKEILHAGPRGFGLLSAAGEVGALGMSLFLASRPAIIRAGTTLLATVVAYGAATIAFGLSRWLPLSLAAYALVGAADQVSVVLRHTVVQLATPDPLRGRVSAINMIFIHASNQLGAFESGALAAATSAPFAVVFGGIAAIVTALAMAGLNRELRQYRVDTGAAGG